MGIKSFLSAHYANMKAIIKFAIFSFIAGLAFASCKKETAVSSSLPVVVTPAQTNKPPVGKAGADVALMLACSQKAGFENWMEVSLLTPITILSGIIGHFFMGRRDIFLEIPIQQKQLLKTFRLVIMHLN